MPRERALTSVWFFFFQFCRLNLFPWLSCLVCWLISSQTQRHLCSMEPRWVNNSQRQLGQKYQALELQDWKVRLDVEGALTRVRFFFLSWCQFFFRILFFDDPDRALISVRFFLFSILSNFLLLSSCFACWLISSKRRVESVAWSPDGASVASGSWDKTAIIWMIIWCRTSQQKHFSGKEKYIFFFYTISIESIAHREGGRGEREGRERGREMYCRCSHRRILPETLDTLPWDNLAWLQRQISTPLKWYIW